MAERTLSNEATLAANYGVNNTPIALASNEVTTTLIDGLTFTKAADKQAWVNGALTYTITINNTTGETLRLLTLTPLMAFKLTAPHQPRLPTPAERLPSILTILQRAQQKPSPSK